MIPCSLKRAIVALLIACSFLMMLPRQAHACGPFFTDAIFVFERHPEFPLERFARGQIGVLQPSYARSYLVAAYRNLSGQPLSDTEINGLKALWEERINLGNDYSSDDWIKKWKDARAKVPGLPAPGEINAYRNREKPNDYETFLNCQQDAFDAATATLNDRITRFGVDSPVARDWATTQDIVFSNCGGGEHIPEAAANDQDPVIRAAHTYQISAANFYATHFEEAAKQFDAIAKDASSPWRLIAPYLAARAMLRKGSLADKPEQQQAPLTEAEQRLNSILKDKNLAKSHHAAARLLNLTRLRLRPNEKLHELADVIVHKERAEDFKQAVWDYTVLIDHLVGDDDEVKADSVSAEVRSDDLTDWILTFQDSSDAAASRAFDQWHRKQTAPWLIAALKKATSNSAGVNELIQAASHVLSSSSAFPSVTFHRVRLLMETSRAPEARILLDRVLSAHATEFPRATVNLLLSQRMMLSENIVDFVRTAQREPAGLSDNFDGREIPTDEKEAASDTNGAKLFFDADAATVFNKLMPVAIAFEAAQNKNLAANLRRDVAQATFMRAAMLDQAVTANKAATLLATLTPELRELLADYQRAATSDARKFAAAFLALKYPGLRPFVSIGIGRTTVLGDVDEYRDNWWCAEPPTTSKIDYYEGDEDEQKEASARRTMRAPEFLKSSRADAAREAAALQALGTGPNYLAQIVISWANKNPTDKRAPEALHLAVKSTRFGCTDKDTGRWSKAAFDLLHRKYPNTSWAKETKYWFKG
jgi:hypothetical protein